MIRRILLAIAIAIAVVFPAIGQTANNASIGEAELAPLFYQRFACTEHVNGELKDLGDALGSDCLVLGGIGASHGFVRFYKTDGATNEDWFGWHVEVHAPFDGVVLEVATNRVTNTPGKPGNRLRAISNSSERTDSWWYTPISMTSGSIRATTSK